jgi:hypothetical protein
MFTVTPVPPIASTPQYTQTVNVVKLRIFSL